MEPSPDDPDRYVGRGGLKLRHALDTFGVDPAGLVCADFGCSTGGFTDCLLQAGAARVYAVDTAYGQLAWKLRTDDRVVVIERTNALHADPPDPRPALVVIDLGWTPQRLAIPAARRWLEPGGRVISLVKPHYEAGPDRLGPQGVLDEADAEAIALRSIAAIDGPGVRVLARAKSPILGGAVGRKRKRKGRGNPEWLVLVEAF